MGVVIIAVQCCHTLREPILTCQYRIKTLHPLIHTDGRAKGDKLVTGCVDGVIAELPEKWSETKTTEVRNRHGAVLKHPRSTWKVPLSKSGSSNARLRSWLPKSIGADALLADGTNWRVILTILDFLCLFVSTSLELSPAPNPTTGTSVGHEIQLEC